MTVPLFELGVPIRTLGEQEALGSLARVEAAGKKTSSSLEQSAKQSATQSAAHFSRMGAAYVQAINAETAKARPSLERQGQQLAQSLTAGLRRQLVRDQANIKEELARGLITPAQAQQRGREAALAFNRGVLQVISQQGAAGGLEGRRGGALFVGLANQIRNVDQAATRAGRGGIRTLASNLAQLAAMELGLRSGLGTTISVLGGLALGSAATLGVVAGLAAIAFAFRKLTQDSREAKERIREFREESQKLGQARLREDPAFLVDEAAAARALAADRERVATEKRAAADKAAADVLTANAKQRDDALRRAHALRNEANKADADARAARTEATDRERVATAALTDARAKEIQQLTTLIGLGRQTAGDEARRAELIAQLTRELDAGNLTLERRAELESQINTLRTAGIKKTTDATKATEEHTRALASLAMAGLATSDDLAELSVIQESLTIATRTGTAEARAQAAALLELVQAARLARLEAALGLGQLAPQLSRTSPRDTRPRRATAAITDEDLRDQGFVTAIPSVGVAFDEAFGRLPEHTQNLFLFQQQMAAVADQMVSMPELLQLGAQAWVTFWEAIGAGEGVVESIGQLFSGVARYFAQYYAAKALAAAAEALLPPPLGNPAAAAAIPALLAASAAFAAIAGATGGGRRSGSSGGGGRTRADLEPREQEFTVRPRLRGPQFGDQSSQVRPIQPIVVNVGPVIGTNDPQAQRDIARLTSNAVDRGYRLGRGR